MGTTGGKVIAALELEAYDLSSPPLVSANRDRYFSDLDLRLHVTCPLDGFTAEATAAQIARMGSYDGQLRTWATFCGRVMQDRRAQPRETGPDILRRPRPSGTEDGSDPRHINTAMAAISIW